MKIDRHNYEEYFILYMDNELGSMERRQVEEFVLKNPDLKEELDVLLQYKLVPDAGIVFENKSQLIRQENNSPVNLVNYEEWLVLYMDNELTTEQKTAVDQFIASNPGVKQELEKLLQTRLLADAAIIFPDKASLYRKEEKVRVLPIRWWRIAAAAVLILAASLTTITILNKKLSSVKAVAKTSGKEQKINTANPVVTVPSDQQATKKSENKLAVEPVIVNNTRQVIPAVSKHTSDPVVLKDKKIIDKKLPGNSPVFINKEEPQVVDNNPKPSNNLPQPLNRPGINNDLSATNTLAANTDKKLIVPKDIITPPVTTNTTQPSYASKNDDGGKKGKLRGFLRKVTRTFEKNTNINATDEQDRVLIGGLAIKL